MIMLGIKRVKEVMILSRIIVVNIIIVYGRNMMSTCCGQHKHGWVFLCKHTEENVNRTGEGKKLSKWVI